ncbi:hypothetical protein [Sphingobacterium kyonggiense]
MEYNIEGAMHASPVQYLTLCLSTFHLYLKTGGITYTVLSFFIFDKE